MPARRQDVCRAILRHMIELDPANGNTSLVPSMDLLYNRLRQLQEGSYRNTIGQSGPLAKFDANGNVSEFRAGAWGHEDVPGRVEDILRMIDGVLPEELWRYPTTPLTTQQKAAQVAQVARYTLARANRSGRQNHYAALRH